MPLSLVDTTSDERASMDEDTSKVFLSCLIGESKNDEMLEQIISRDPCCRILESRLEAGGFVSNETATPAAILFCGVLSEGNPGRAVMWAYALATLSKTSSPVSMHTLSEIFPWGFPTEEGYARIWEDQKSPGAPLGNLMDSQETWGELRSA